MTRSTAPADHRNQVRSVCQEKGVQTEILVITVILAPPSMQERPSKGVTNGQGKRRRNGSERAASLIHPTGINLSGGSSGPETGVSLSGTQRTVPMVTGLLLPQGVRRGLLVIGSNSQNRWHQEDPASGPFVCPATVCAPGNIRRTVRPMLPDRIPNRAAISAWGRPAVTMPASTWQP